MSQKNSEVFGSEIGLRAEICACGTVHLHFGFLHLKFSREGFGRVLGFLRDVEARLRSRESIATSEATAPSAAVPLAKA